MLARPYQPGDEKQILQLFQTVFGRSMTEEYWRWRFQNHPSRNILIELAWDNSTLAAHYAVSPLTLTVHGTDYGSALSMTTMTHPSYRGKGLFKMLAESVYDRMQKNRMHVVWGFPNSTSHRGFIREISWEDIYEIPMLRKILTGSKHPPKASANIETINRFHPFFETLWSEASKRYTVLTKRTPGFLQWRYCENPGHQYSILGYREKERLLGYVVYKRYTSDVDIVDLLSVSDEVDADLIIAVAQKALLLECNALNCWINLNSSLHRELEKIGFQNSSPVTYFGARLLRSDISRETLINYRNWYVTLGDSDVY